MNTCNLNLIDGSIKKYYINDIDDLINQLNKEYIYYSVFIDTTKTFFWPWWSSGFSCSDLNMMIQVRILSLST